VCGAHTIKLIVTLLFPDLAIKENHKGLKENYGRLTDLLSKISKLSYINLLDFADFLMHH